MQQKYYVDDSILNEEMTNIFFNRWVCCGRSQDTPNIGDYKLINIGNESIIILRDDQHQIKAFFNVCRHRGTKICIKEEGCFSKSIQCPYHGWTYDLKGKLHTAPNMDAVNGFIKNDYSLHDVKLAEWEGFIFLNLANEPKDFSLDLYAYYMAKKSRLVVKRFPVVFAERVHGVSNWNISFISKYHFIKRTLLYSFVLQKRMR